MAARDLPRELRPPKAPKVTSTLLLRIKKSEDELNSLKDQLSSMKGDFYRLKDEFSNHLTSWEAWKQKVEYTLEQTGIELIDPPPPSANGSSLMTPTSKPILAESETEDMEIEDAVNLGEDSDRESGSASSEVSTWTGSAKSNEVAASETSTICPPILSPQHSRSSVEQFEDNSSVEDAENNPPLNSVAPKNTEVQVQVIPASFKPSKRIFPGSRHKRIKRPCSKPKKTGIPKKSFDTFDGTGQQSPANGHTNKAQNSYQTMKLEQEEALRLLHVFGSGHSKSYKCKVCNHFEEKRPDAVAHARFSHGNGRNYPCPQCSFRFKNTWDVQRHLTKIHSGSGNAQSSYSTTVGVINPIRINQAVAAKHSQGNKIATVSPKAVTRSQEDFDKEVKEAYARVYDDNRKIKWWCLSCHFISDAELVLRKHVLRNHKCPYCTELVVETSKLEKHIKQCYSKNSYQRALTGGNSQHPNQGNKPSTSRAIAYGNTN